MCGFGQVVIAIADKYRELGFPGAWFLPNDGYGCGYGEAQDPVGVKSFPHEFDDLDYVSCTTNHA